MRKIIASINMTLDGFCDHTAVTPDEEIHQHYADLLSNADAILFGKTTYRLMEYWQTVLKNPTGNKAIDEFAMRIDKIPKIVFSHTLEKIEWKTARLAGRSLGEEVAELKKQPGKDIFVGSPGLIVQLTKLGLIDEYQLCVHPVVAGNGLPLFKDINGKINFTLLRTKIFGSGAVLFTYKPTNEFLSLLPAPARRALQNNGITTLEELANYSENEIMKLHGFGKKSLPILQKVLKDRGLSFNK